MLYRMKSMRRREFMGVMGSVAVAWPGIAVSQSGRPIGRIGVLMGTSEGDAEVHPHLITSQKALQELGWTDGRNVQIDYRFAVSDPQRIRAAAAELFGLKQDVLVAQSTPEIRALLETYRNCADRVPNNRRSGRQQFRTELRATRRQRNWVHQLRGGDGRQVARLAQGNGFTDVSSVALVLHPNDEYSAAGCEARSRQRRPRSEWD